MDTAPGIALGRWRDPLLWTGLGLFAFQLLLAWRFFLERTATADSAFFSFLLIDSGLPVEALGRYGSWPAQLPALLLIHLGASTDVVLRTYSLSFVVIDVLVFLVLAFRLRDREAMLVLPLVKTVAFHYTFYYGISELNQGLTLMVLAWALLKRWLDGAGRGWAAGLIALVVWSSFYHQLLVFPLAFVLAVESVRRSAWRDRRLWTAALVLVGWFAVRILVFTRSSYEAQRMPSVQELIEHGSALWTLGSTQHLLQVFPKFKAFLLLAVITVAVSLWRRSWLLLVGTVLTSTGFMVLVLITDRDGASPNIYENYYTVQGFFWAVLFAVVAFSWRTRMPAVPAAQLLVLALGCMQVWRAHDLLTAHVRYAQRITGTLRDRGAVKAVADLRNFPWTYAWGQWPLAMETLLASSAEGPGMAATVFACEDATPFDSVMRAPHTFLGPTWDPTWFTTDHFPKAQFHLPRQPYVRMNTVMHDSLADRFRPSDVVIEPVERTVTLAHDRYTVVEVRVTNRSAYHLGSLLSDGAPLRLSYHLQDANGEPLMWEGVRSPLEIDVPPGASHVQGLVVERPERRGTYRLIIDVVQDGRRWWGVDAPLTVIAGW